MNKLFDQQSFGSGGTNFWIGQVVDDSTWRDNINPKLHEDTEKIDGWGYRYKVRIFGNQTKNKTDEVTDEELPMAEVLYPVTAGSGHAGSKQTPNIRQGNFVLGYYKDGLDSQQPVILGVIANNDNTELEGGDPDDGFVPRTGVSGLSGDVTVAAKDQLLVSNGSGKPVREGASVTIAAVSDPMQALGGNESTALPVADKNEESETESIQVIIKNLLAILNKVRSSQGSFFGASTAPVKILKGEISKATNMVASFLKSIIQKIRGAVITALNNAVKDTIYLLFPNKRPELNEAQNKATDTLGCVFNKIIDGLIALVSNFLKELIQKYVNAPLCAIESFVGKILNKASRSITKALDTVLGPVETVLSSLTSGIGGAIGSFSSIANQIAAVLQFLSCDKKQDNPKIREWSPWAGIKVKDPLSGPLGNLIAQAGVGGGAPPCNTGPSLVKPPSLSVFGGNPTVQAQLNPILSSSGEIIGADIVNPGSGYESSPSIVVTSSNGGGLVGGGAVINPIVTGGSVTSILVKSSGSGYPLSSDGTTTGAGDIVFSTPDQTIVFSPPPGPVIPQGTVLDNDYTTFEGTSIPSGLLIPTGTNLVTDIILPDGTILVEGTTLNEDFVAPFGNSIPEGSVIPANSPTPYDVEVSTILDLPDEILDEIEPETFSNSFEPGDQDGLLNYGYNAYSPNTDLILNEGDQVFMPVGTTADITDNLGNVLETLVGSGPTTPITITTPGNFTTPEPQTNIVGETLNVGGTGGIPVSVNGVPLTSNGEQVVAGGSGGVPLTVGATGGSPVVSGNNVVVSGGTGGTQITVNGLSVVAGDSNISIQSVGGDPVTVGGIGGTPVTVGNQIESGDQTTDGLGKYPIVLSIKDAIVLDKGINYQSTDKIQVVPDNGAVLEPVFDNFGKLIDVNVVDGGIGFTELPTAFITSKTGINAKIQPVFDVIRVGEDVEDSTKIPDGTPVIKVVDCVGQVL